MFCGERRSKIQGVKNHQNSTYNKTLVQRGISLQGNSSRGKRANTIKAKFRNLTSVASEMRSTEFIGIYKKERLESGVRRSSESTNITPREDAKRKRKINVKFHLNATTAIPNVVTSLYRCCKINWIRGKRILKIPLPRPL